MKIIEAPQLDDAEISVLAKVSETSAGIRLRLQEKGNWTHHSLRYHVARSLQGAGALAGCDVSLDDVAAIDLGESTIDSSEETRLALQGYRDALTYVGYVSSDGDTGCTSQLLKSLHFIVGRHDAKGRPGRWRVGEAVVDDVDSSVRGHPRPAPEEIPASISQVLSCANADSSPALVRAAMAHLNILMVQPFERRNGSMGRCLHTLVLASQGVLLPAYGSIDEYLGRNIDAYHEVLADIDAESTRVAHLSRNWVRFMLTAHLRQTQSVRQRLKDHEVIWQRLERVVSSRLLPERSIVALFDASLGHRVRSTTYRAALEQSSPDGFFETITEVTASRDLRQLADVGLLTSVGEKRGRHYRATPDVVAIRKAVTRARLKKAKSSPFHEKGD